MLNLIPKEPNNLFDKIFYHYNKLFNMPKAMCSRVPRFIQKAFILTKGKSIDGYCIIQDHDDYSIVLILESNTSDNDKITDDSGIYNDRILFDSKIYNISVINESLLEDSDDIEFCEKQIKGFYQSFKFTIENIYPHGVSSLGKMIFFSPIVLTFKLISMNYHNINNGALLIYNSIEEELKDDSMYKLYIENGEDIQIPLNIYEKMYDFSAKELLDDFGILALKNGNEEAFRDFVYNPEGL